MIWNFIFFIAGLFFTTLIGIGIAYFVWTRQHESNWRIPFIVLALSAAVWSFGYAFELGLPTIQQKLFWAKIEYIGIAAVPVAWYFFALQYTNRSNILFDKYWLGFFVIPLITIFLVFFNGRFHLIWQIIKLDDSLALPVFSATYGAWFWVHLAYSYILLILGTLTILFSIFSSPKIYKQQNLLLMVASLMPLIGNALFITGITTLDFSPIGFIISGLCIGFAISHLHLFDLIPIGRKAVVEYMEDAYIVLDLNQRIIDANFTAKKLLNAPKTEVVSKNFETFIKDGSVISQIKKEPSSRKEVQLHVNSEDKIYDLIVSPLYDFRHKLRGQLLVFRDVTIERLAKDGLERLVEERTLALADANAKLSKRALELETVAHLNAAATTVLDVEKLLQTVADLTIQHFEFYAVLIYAYHLEEKKLTLMSMAHQRTLMGCNYLA